MHRQKHSLYLSLILLFCLSLLIAPFIQAQDTTDDKAETTEEPASDQPPPEITQEPIIIVTEEPTVAPTAEITAEPTEPAPAPTQEATEEATQEVTPEPVEPPVQPTPITDAFQDNFDDGDAAGWQLNGWQVTNGAGGFVLESTAAGAAASVDGVAWPHFLLAAQVRVPAGVFSLALRDGYSITLDSTGTTRLLRLNEVVAEGTAALDGNWAQLNVQALGGVITVAVNRTAQFSYTDPEALIGAAPIVFGADSAGIRLDEVSINRLDEPEPVETTPEPTEIPNPLQGVALSPEQQAMLTAVQQGGTVRVIVGLPGASSSTSQLQQDLVQIRLGRQDLVSRLSASGASFEVLSDSMEWTIPYVAFRVDEVGLITLLTTPQVTSVIEDGIAELTLDSSTAVINADEVWALGGDGSGRAVAVLDTGVQSNHPFLGGRITAEACFSENFCPNGRYVQKGRGAASPATCLNFYPNTDADCSHGTHVSGIAAGYNANPTGGQPASGVAPSAKIVAVQVFSYTGGPRPGAYWIDIISALNWVYSVRNQYNIAAINMSLGAGQYFSTCDTAVPPLTDIINQLRSAGVATVISAGNDSFTDSIGIPACISSAVSVGSTTDGDAISYFSNRATFMTVFAPGSSIISSIAGSSYSNWQGTSMAAPHVTGAFAVLRQANPNASVNQIVNALRNTGVPIAISGGSVPRIDLRAALNSIVLAPRDRPRLLTSNNFLTNDDTPVLNWGTVDFGYAYDIQIDNDRRFGSPEYTANDVQPNHTVTTNLPDGRYYWRVRGTNPGGDGAWSSSRKFTVDTIPTDAPELRSPKDDSTQSNLRPNFLWRRPRGGYEFQIQIDNDNSFASPVIDWTGRKSRYRPSSPLEQGTYYWRVRSYDKAGNVSGWSDVFTVIFNLARVPRDESFITSRSGTSSPNFSWARLPGAINYELQIADSNNFSNIVFNASSTRTGYRLASADALPYGTYYWRVRPDMGSGFVTPPAEVYNTMTVTPPSPPRTRINAPLSNSFVADSTLIEWDAVTYSYGGTITYRIQVSADSRFRSLDANDTTTSTSASSLSGLAAGTYYVRVQAENQYGKAGGWSSRIRVNVIP